LGKDACQRGFPGTIGLIIRFTTDHGRTTFFDRPDAG
jgi:hypothetical protein